MKSEKGITIISLVIYMIAITIAVAALAGLSSFFFTNKDYLFEETQYMAEYNKFNMYFIEDVKNNTTLKVTDNEIVFGDGHVYTYRKKGTNGEKDEGIYRDKVKICENVKSCKFQLASGLNDKKTIVEVIVQIDNFRTSNSYVLKYW